MALTAVIAVVDCHVGGFFRKVGEQFTLDLEDARYKGHTGFVPVDKKPVALPVDPNVPPPGAGPRKGSRAKADDALA